MIETLYKKFLEAQGKICTDTRNNVENAIFFAWKGENSDGNIFAAEALEKGALIAVVDNPEFHNKNDDRYILVDNGMSALATLAHHHRKQFNIPIVGLTGSNGKTTTKELISEVLKTEKNIVATKGNLNNHVGVPKTLLDIDKQTEIAIIEMGANHVGEIANLCAIAEPTHGLITNIGRAHLGLFGGFDGVVRAKTELYRFLENLKGVSFVNGHDELLLTQSNTNQKITYFSEKSEYPVVSLETSPFVSVKWKTHIIKTQLTGEYNLPNIAAAIALGSYFHISEENICKALMEYQPTNERSEIVEQGTNNIIKDYYNANRSSMELALGNFENIKTEKTKIAILGDMFELGEYSQEEHQAVIERAILTDCKKIILVGEHFAALESSFSDFGQVEILFFKTTDSALDEMKKKNFENSYILLKASQGMNFKKIFREIFNHNQI